ITSLAQMAADELDVALESVDMLLGDTDLCPWDMGTFGSRTTRFFGPALRGAAAEARTILLDLAAEQWQVPRERLSAENGKIYDKNDRTKSISYGELARGKVIERHLQAQAALKTPNEFRIVGKPVLRRDGVEKVTGKAQFSGDIRLPGMLYAKILRPPSHDAKFISADTSEAEKVAGVQVVRQGELVAVLHPLPDQAEEALGRIKAQFDKPAAQVDDKTIFDHLLKNAPDRNVVDQGGDVEKGAGLADVTVEETYLNSYVAHAAIETHTALAQVEADKATVWASTQVPFRIKDQVAEAIGCPADKVRVITPFVGGGFGGKSAGRQVVEAAQLAKLTGKPVQVAWSRQEEFFYDTFRPAAVVKIKSGFSKAGKLVFWDYGVYFAGERGSQQFYDIPHHRTASYGNRGGVHPFGTGAWRAPANNTNTFARESQIDMLASRAGVDPVQFRLDNLKDRKFIRVLEAAAKKFGWTPAKAPSRRGLGVALGTDSGTCVATIAQVEVDRQTGRVRVKRVVCAQDMGLAINPEGATIQMEGCITMGLGYALTEEVRFRGGDVLDRNFDTYELPRFSWLPEIETVIIEAKDEPAQGGGEPAIITMGAVVANAIFDATGARLFQLPMTPERVLAALKG
ncbi:MAG: molybdopterin cofactor-binding domain-containing protein, partial [Candidatus Glassbacteria bacterium]